MAKAEHLSDHIDPERHSLSVVYINPSMARRILKKNTCNRRISELHVIRLRNEMESGRWQYNGEAIKWSVTDQLLDGQHRMIALSRLDDSVTFPFLVLRGLPADSQDTMDQGRTRTAADQLTIAEIRPGDRNMAIIAGAIRVYLQWTEGKFFGDQVRPDRKVSNPQVVAWAKGNPHKIAIMSELCTPDLKRVKIRPSLALAIIFRLHTIDPDACQGFTAGLYTGVGLWDGNPILTLRERLDRIKSQAIKVSDRDLVAFFVLAWNAYRDGRSLTKFQRPNGGSWAPENYPQPK